MAGTLTASVIKNDTTSPPTFQNSAGTEIGTLCRAWVNFNGSGGTIRASFNVSSVTVNGTGDYTLNFATALADANYALSGSIQRTTNDGVVIIASSTSPTASAVRIETVSPGVAYRNYSIVDVNIFR